MVVGVACSPPTALRPRCGKRPVFHSLTREIHACMRAPTLLVVYCCSNDRTWPYIYAPVVNTLVEGVRRLATTWDVRTLIIPVLDRAYVFLSQESNDLRQLKWPDVAVCVGPLGCPSMPYTELRSRGVLTAYYQTEPMHSCTRLLAAVDEVWDFSWHNLRVCRRDTHGACSTFRPKYAPDSLRIVNASVRPKDMRCQGGCNFDSDDGTNCHATWKGHELACAHVQQQGKHCATLRYVPLGALNHTLTTRPLTAIRPTNMLSFLGQPRYRDKKCWHQLQAQLNKHNASLITHNDVWDDVAYFQLLGSTTVFINLHKSVVQGSANWAPICGDSHNPATFRFAKLLNVGAILISERCYPADEAEFHGLVSFVDFDSIGNEFARLRDMDVSERMAMAHHRRVKFFGRFDPALIMKRAGIASMLAARIGLDH